MKTRSPHVSSSSFQEVGTRGALVTISTISTIPTLEVNLIYLINITNGVLTEKATLSPSPSNEMIGKAYRGVLNLIIYILDVHI